MSVAAGHIPTANLAEFHNLERQQNWTFDYRSFTGPIHVSALHPSTSNGAHRKGKVAFAQRAADGSWREWMAGTGAAADEAAIILNGPCDDVFVSQQTFIHRRSISQLSALGAAYCDLDFHKTEQYAGRSVEQVKEAVLAHLSDHMAPAPSYILSTGRGLVCVWLHDLLPRQALPRWLAVQKHIASILAPFGADRAAIDAARVFRLAGSSNSNAPGSRVGMIWVQGTPQSPTRHSFDTLADEILPHTQAEIKQFREDRKKKREERAEAAQKREKAQKPQSRFTAESYYDLVLQELQALRHYRAPDGPLPEGQRDTWVFIASCAMAYLCPPDQMEREVIALAEEAVGWKSKEAKRAISSALKRARLKAMGKDLHVGGKKVDPRYRFYARTIVDWLQITTDEMRGAGLKLLVTQEIKNELAVKRREKSRRKHGARSRDEQQRLRRKIGTQCHWMTIKDGMSIRELAMHFEVSVGYIVKAMAETKSS